MSSEAANSSSATGCEIQVMCGVKDVRILGGKFEASIAKVVYDADRMLAPPTTPSVQGCSVKMLADVERVEVNGDFVTAATLIVPEIRNIPQYCSYEQRETSPSPFAYEHTETRVYLPLPPNLQIAQQSPPNASPQSAQLSPLTPELRDMTSLPEHSGLLMRMDQ